MGEDRTEGAQFDEYKKQYVTVGEAAKLLGVHRNTVHHRIKVGRITAHKVVEGEREVYRIERDSLNIGRTGAHVHTLDAQRTTATEELSRTIATRLDVIVRDYVTQLGDLREELGAERARRKIAEDRAADLEAKLIEVREATASPALGEETPTPDPAHAQAATENRERQDSARPPLWQRIRRRIFGGG